VSNSSFKDPGLSQPALHRYLWEHSNRHREVKVNQHEMGELLGVTRFTILRHLREMCHQGRIQKLTNRTSEGNVGTYKVFDPDDPKFDNSRDNPKRYPGPVVAAPAANPAVAERRQLKWG
jgi:hypothetical protein